jgi:hypothetical protein
MHAAISRLHFEACDLCHCRGLTGVPLPSAGGLQPAAVTNTKTYKTIGVMTSGPQRHSLGWYMEDLRQVTCPSMSQPAALFMIQSVTEVN